MLGVVLVCVVLGVMTACCSNHVCILMWRSVYHHASSVENVNTCHRCFSCLMSFAHVAAVYLLQSTVFPNA